MPALFLVISLVLAWLRQTKAVSLDGFKHLGACLCADSLTGEAPESKTESGEKVRRLPKCSATKSSLISKLESDTLISAVLDFSQGALSLD